MAPAPTQVAKHAVDPVVDRYITEFQSRHRDFVRYRKAELRQIGLDAFTRVHHDYFSLPSKPAYDVLLQAILDPAERDRLLIDPQFTQAWQIFVDLCWMRARSVRTGIIVGTVVFCLTLAGIIIVLSPQFGGVAVVGVIGMFLGVWALPILLARKRR